MQRFENAANMLVAGRKVSVAVRELPQGNVQAWLAELKSYVIFGHTDPGDEVTYKVYVTVKDGRAVAQAKLAYIDWLLPLPLTRVRGLCSTHHAVVSSTFPQPCGKLHVICGKRGYFGVSPRDTIRWKDCRRKGSQRLTRQAGR